MLRLMLDAGLRLSEAIHLQWLHIDLDSSNLMVREGRGKKDRTLWTGEENLGQLKQWKERQTLVVGKPCERVVTTLTAGKLHPCYIQWMVKRYAGKPEIQKDISPHSLRHSFASDLHRETGNIRITQKALGHSNLATTQIYTHIVDEELEGALKSFRTAKVAA